MSLFELDYDIMKQILKDIEYKKNYNKLVKEVDSKWRRQTIEECEEYMNEFRPYCPKTFDKYIIDYWDYVRIIGLNYRRYICEGDILGEYEDWTISEILGEYGIISNVGW